MFVTNPNNLQFQPNQTGSSSRHQLPKLLGHKALVYGPHTETGQNIVNLFAQHGADLTLVYPQDKSDEVDSIICHLEDDDRVLMAHAGLPRILPVAVSVEVDSPQRQADAHVSYHDGLDTLIINDEIPTTSQQLFSTNPAFFRSLVAAAIHASPAHHPMVVLNAHATIAQPAAEDNTNGSTKSAETIYSEIRDGITGFCMELGSTFLPSEALPAVEIAQPGPLWAHHLRPSRPGQQQPADFPFTYLINLARGKCLLLVPPLESIQSLATPSPPSPVNPMPSRLARRPPRGMGLHPP